MSDLAKALVKAQSEFPTIGRSKDVRVQTKTGSSYTFSYAPLDEILNAVRPVLKANGLAVSQLLGNVGGQPALKTMLMHEGGDVIQDTCPLPMNGSLSAQEFGSLVTYFRRYALVTVLGIATEEDDDGNHASGNTASGVGSEGGGSSSTAPTPEDIFIKAATEATKPSEMPIHFGKNRGVLLGSLTPAQLRWYANDWTIQEEPSEYDHRLKLAAVALHGGDDSPLTVDPYPDVPF